MLTTLLLSLGANIIMAGLSFLKIDAWKTRGFDAREIRWSLLIIISAIVGTGLGVFSYVGSENPYTSTTIAIAGYLMVFSSVVDIMLLKIPSEPTKMAGFLGGVLFLFSIPTLIPENYLSLAFWALIIAVFGICSMLNYLGDADMRIFVAFFFLFAWWIPPTELTTSLLLMSILGLTTTLLSRFFNIGVEKSLKERTRWNPDTAKMESYSTQQTKSISGRKAKRKAEGKKHKFFPFGPAILIAFVAIAIFASFNSIVIPTLYFTP